MPNSSARCSFITPSAAVGSEAPSTCREAEDLTRIPSEQLREFLDFFQFYIIVYKENSREVERVRRCAGRRAARVFKSDH